MTEDEFVRKYAEGTGMTPAEIREHMLKERDSIPAPCGCGKDYCQGWAWKDMSFEWMERRR